MMLQSFITKLKAVLPAKPSTQRANDYFTQAASWADDVYTLSIASRNRWRAACLYGLLPAVGMLLVSITYLIPEQHLSPILINHYPDGTLSAMPASSHMRPQVAQIKSDLVRYVISREAYSPYTYAHQYALTHLLSSHQVSAQYALAQAAANPHAPINVLGKTGQRKVRVQSVLLLDRAQSTANTRHRNLAQVNFTLTDSKEGLRAKPVFLTALIVWRYTGVPSDPGQAWQNWEGFEVVSYQVEQRNV